MSQPTYSQPEQPMYYIEEGLDLRAYIHIILRHWRLIVLTCLVTAFTAAFVSLMQEPQYEATTLITAMKPNVTVRLDAASDSEILLDRQVFVKLATSDELLQQLRQHEALSALLPADLSLAGLKGMVSANNVRNDPSLLELKVTAAKPAEAAQVANLWADLFVLLINDLYAEDDEQIDALTHQLEVATKARTTDQEALIAFEYENNLSIVEAQLLSFQEAYQQGLTEQSQITSLQQNMESFQAQIDTLSPSTPISLEDDLTKLVLQFKAFNTESAQPLLQISADGSHSNKTASDVSASLSELQSTLSAKLDKIETQLASLKPEILTIQGELQTLRSKQEQLQQNYELAQQTYTTLVQKVEEIRLASQLTSSEVKVASYTAVPEKPVGPKTLINVALAAIVGLMVGLGSAFFIEYWQDDPLLADEAMRQQSQPFPQPSWPQPAPAAVASPIAQTTVPEEFQPAPTPIGKIFGQPMMPHLNGTANL